MGFQQIRDKCDDRFNYIHSYQSTFEKLKREAEEQEQQKKKQMEKLEQERRQRLQEAAKSEEKIERFELDYQKQQELIRIQE